MANREVNLTKRVQTPYGMRYCRVVLSANGRVKPDVVRLILDMMGGRAIRSRPGRHWSSRAVAPIVGGVLTTWESMRGTVVKNFLAPPGPSKAYLD